MERTTSQRIKLLTALFLGVEAVAVATGFTRIPSWVSVGFAVAAVGLFVTLIIVIIRWLVARGRLGLGVTPTFTPDDGPVSTVKTSSETNATLRTNDQGGKTEISEAP
jgi:hypothetical protein